MEVVHIFNKELKSILECKLPVSRHKMSLITKSAMKALKFYKHVVQSVEKFITKCSCDYKVPGLYVIDAIVRQSKHQYCDKDVFVPRFMRNIVTTFVHLSHCDPKDLTSLERVLRLWQQNGVFPTDLVEALLELVYDASDNSKIRKASKIVFKLVNEWNTLKGKPEENIEIFMPHTDSIVQSDIEPKTEGGLIDSITKLLTRFQAETGQDVSLEINQIQILHQKIVEQSALLAQGEMIDSDTLSQLHQSMEELTKKAAKAAAVQQSKLAMLASDDKDHMNEASTDLEFVEQLQQMVDTLGQTRALQEELKQALESKENTTNDIDIPIIDQDFRDIDDGEEDPPPPPMATMRDIDISKSEDTDLRMLQMRSVPSRYETVSDHVREANNASADKTSRTSSDGSRKRRRSNSDSGVGKRHRSRSKDPKRRQENRKHHDTRKRHLPSLRDQCVGIISHTMFIGHLHKHVSESKLRTLCEEFGSIAEFNMIPPRGCAFVTFDKRKSTQRAIQRMNELKFEGRDLKVAWAPNKGVKDEREFKEFWCEEEGCTYIPMEQFPINRSSELIDGSAELDEGSLTSELREAIYQFEQRRSEAVAHGLEPSSVETMISVVAASGGERLALLSPIDCPGTIIDPPAPPFFGQFSTPPPMIPSFPPPLPHLFMPGATSMPPPPLQMCPDNSVSSVVGGALGFGDYLGSPASSTSAEQGMNGPSTPIDTNVTIPPPAPGMYSPQSMPPRLNDNHRVQYLRPPGFMSPIMLPSRGRYIRPPLRFTRPPPPGYPSFRPNMINRPPAPRF